MKMLLIHSEYLKYKPTRKAVKAVRSVERKEFEIKNVLVAFSSFEKDDEKNPGLVAKKAAGEIESKFKEVKAKNMVLYPYAHLSSSLASPAIAQKILNNMEKLLKKKYKVHTSPFGFYKAFELRCLGHPLAEAFKEITAEGVEGEEEEVVSKALKAEKKLKSHWLIMRPSGKLIPVDKFDFSKHRDLEKFKNYEIAKVRAVQQMPPHVTLMRKLEIADFEPGSDPGNLRFYPKGSLIKSLLEQFVTQMVIAYGGIEVETPVMYDFQHPSLADYLNRFPARQYTIKSGDREFFLRFSACFGQFLLAHDSQLSYKHLPFRIYELTRYSFRREKSGELVGLRRLRAFTMPDVHAMCADLNQAMKEFVVRFKLCRNVLKGIGLDKKDYEFAIRFTKEFYKQNKKFIESLVKMVGKPALVEMWDKRFFYFILKWEFNFVDNLNKASALSTDQIDIENGKRYGITFTDENGKKRYPIILHCSPSGAIERCMYALLEKAYAEQKKGKVPKLPLWLSPTQVRVIPLSDKYVKDSKKIAEKIERNRIRVDIDDRRETVEKKIRDSELEWVPYILVIGPKELKSKKLSVRIRELGKVKRMGLEKLVNEIGKSIKDKPFKKLPLPKLLSKRPIFVG